VQDVPAAGTGGPGELARSRQLLPSHTARCRWLPQSGASVGAVRRRPRRTSLFCGLLLPCLRQPCSVAACPALKPLSNLGERAGLTLECIACSAGGAAAGAGDAGQAGGRAGNVPAHRDPLPAVWPLPGVWHLRRAARHHLGHLPPVRLGAGVRCTLGQMCSFQPTRQQWHAVVSMALHSL
jgi:hypothetical protein